MRLNFGSLTFIGIMLGAAGLSMVRILIVAAMLPKLDFGIYAAVTSTGAFLGSFVSFGSIEGTVKTFPRLIMIGQFEEMRKRAHGLFGRLALRSLGFGGPVFAAGLFLSNQILIVAGAATLFALSTSYTSLLASMQRAVGDSQRLAAGTMLRVLLTLVAVTLTAHFAGMVWALIAEATSAVVGCLLSERLFLQRLSVAAPAAGQVAKAETPAASTRDGILVFLTYTAVSVPFYLDRIYVTATLGRERASEYAFLALFVMAASLLVNAIAQRVGPDAIKKSFAPGGAQDAVRYVIGWCAIGVAIWLMALAMAVVVLHQGWLPASLAKYGIKPAFLLPIGALGALQINVLLEFLLLALDRERRMFAASLSYLASVLAVAAAAAVMKVDLVGLIWMLAGARLLYCGVLALALLSAMGRGKSSAHA